MGSPDAYDRIAPAPSALAVQTSLSPCRAFAASRGMSKLMPESVSFMSTSLEVRSRGFSGSTCGHRQKLQGDYERFDVLA